MSLSDKELPFYHKFHVYRSDGSSIPGQKHAKCEYFVLDLMHDKFVKPALAAYADACEVEYPLLAQSIRTRIEVIDNPDL